jgi:hypothetical protein
MPYAPNLEQQERERKNKYDIMETSIFNVGTRWNLVVSFTLLSLYARMKRP